MLYRDMGCKSMKQYCGILCIFLILAVFSVSAGAHAATITGTSGNDNLVGTSEDDTISGLDGNDSLAGGVGNDLLNGGPGLDTAVFQGNSSDYHIGLDGQGRPTITRQQGQPLEGTDTLVSIEYVQFNDYLMPLPPPPTVTLSIVPNTILVGETATMSWTSQNAVVCYINHGIGSVPLNGSISGSPAETTTYTITAYGLGGATSTSATITVNHEPTATLEVSPTTILAGQSATLTWTSTYADTCSIDQGVGSVATNGSVSVSPTETTTYTITATGGGGAASASATVTVEPNPVEPQPEGSFGQQYEDLVPADATHAEYEPARFAVITGLVHDASDNPIQDVSVTVLDHADYGTAHTDAEGRFAIPVEGGSLLTVQYEKTGFISAQRQVEVPWNDLPIVETVVLISQDTESTVVQFDGNPATIVVHEGSTVTDASGSRSCTLVFTGDNQAYETTADGQIIGPLNSITVRTTEFPTEDAMPAKLPPASAFTWCAQIRADEAEYVSFDDPVVSYVDNFLGFAVGTIVPVGYYDVDQGLWKPLENGVVVRLLDTNSDGTVDALDSTGDGVADDLNGNANFSDEVAGLGDTTRYAPDSTFWRVSLAHFSDFDFNWPVNFPPGTKCPYTGRPAQTKKKDSCCTETNSYVTDRSQTFEEDIAIPGTGLALHYASDRTAGYDYRITVPIVDDEVPESLTYIVVLLRVAGRSFLQELPAQSDQIAEFDWDGLDALGRPVSTNVVAHVGIGYRYLAEYAFPINDPFSFGRSGTGGPTGVTARSEMILWTWQDVPILATKNKGTVAEGWTLSAHHQLDRNVITTLLRGDGSMFPDPTNITPTIHTVAGQYDATSGGDGGFATEAGMSWATSMVYDSVGNLYIAEDAGVRKVDTFGMISTVSSYTGELAVDDADNLYIGSINQVRKLTPQASLSLIAGNGNTGHTGDGGPALDASFNEIAGVAADSWGNIYIADSDIGPNPYYRQFLSRIRRIDTNGIITTVAGGGSTQVSTTTPFPAVQAALGSLKDLVVARNGVVYIAQDYRVLSLDTAGRISAFAGIGSDEGSTPQDSGLAIDTTFLPEGLALDAEENVYVADSFDATVFRIGRSNLITEVAGELIWGSGDPDYANGIPALDATIDVVIDVAVSPSGDVCYLDQSGDHSVARKVTRDWFFPGPDTVVGDDFLIPDEDGSGLLMTSNGRHLQTIDLRTRTVMLEFGYDSENRIESITDRFGNAVTVQRDSGGVPTAIVSADGLVTQLTITNNRLNRVTYADGGYYDFEYNAGGLMTLEIDPNGNEYVHDYDSSGRVTSVSDPEGGQWDVGGSTDDSGLIHNEIATAEGNTTTYVDTEDFSGDRSTEITGPSGEVSSSSVLRDGMLVIKHYPTGMDLELRYSTQPEDPLLDYLPERQHSFLKRITERTPSGLTVDGEFTKEQADTDSDGYPDLFTSTVTTNGKTSTSQDDLLNGIATSTSPLGRTTTSYYDPETLLTIRDESPGVYDTVYGYDARGRITSVTQNTRQVTYAYNTQGLLDSTTDPLNRTTSYAYDAVGRLTTVYRPDNTSVGYTYDANGNMTALATPNTAFHSFLFNAVDQVTDYITPLDLNGDQPYTYVYDRDRRLVRTVFPSGAQIVNVYSGANLLQTQTPEGNIDFTYFCPGKVQTIQKGSEGITFAYDGTLLTTETRTGTLPQTLSFGYDNDFQLVSFQYAGSTSIFTYDDDGLTTRAGAFIIARNAQTGFPVTISDTNSVYTPSYSGYGEVNGQTTVVGGVGVGSWGLTRNDLGLITAKTETVGGTTDNYEYSYDLLGRLTTVVKGGIPVESYTYGANGERLTETNTLRGITNRSFTYSLEDHLLSTSTATYQYNDDGYLTGKFEGLQNTLYQYSSRGELLRVDLPGGDVIEYVHDALGRRVAKKVNGTITEKYLWSGMTQLLAVYDASNTLIMRFDGARMTRSGATYYLVTDQIGTVRAIVDTTGTIVKRIDYDSFGNIINDTNPTFTIPFGFAGGLHDRDTGLVRFGFRDYDPDSGRWTAKDPILFEGGDTNLYGYCVGNPISLADADGLIIETAFDIASIGYDVYSFAKKPSWGNAGALAVDTVATFLPFVPAPGTLVRVGGKALGAADKLGDINRAGKAISEAEKMAEVRRIGNLGEDLAGIEKNRKYFESGGRRICPDEVTSANITEVKNCAKLSKTKQITNYKGFADETGRSLTVVTREDTVLSRPLQQMRDSGQIIIDTSRALHR